MDVDHADCNTQPKPTIAPDVPFDFSPDLKPETIEARKTLMEAIAEAEAREFLYMVCPTEWTLLHVTGYDEKGNSNRWHCPKCGKETTTPLERKYHPSPKTYVEFTQSGIKELPLKAQEIADDIKANYLFKTDRKTLRVYRYDEHGQVWIDDGHLYLQELLARILEHRNTESIFKNVLHCLKCITYEEFEPSKAVIATTNGLLNPEKRTLTPFTPNEFVVQQIPHKFAPEAKCPTILKMVTEIVGENQLTVLQESIGNIFLKGHPFHKITIFIGGGGNGKGQVLALITHLVGVENVSNVTLQALCSDKFERATCYRKMVNLGRDIPQSKISVTGNAKMMSGDDTMTMQNKYGQPFQATPDNLPKQFYSCNQLPPSDDDTDAWYRRQNLIAFNNHFVAGENAVPQIADKLAESETEMSGLLNWALEGTARLLKNKCFSANENIEENREKYVKNSNPAQAFIEANLVHEQDKYIPEKECWSKVGLWCAENGIASPRNKGAFTQELTKQIPQVIQTSARVEGKSTHVYMNVTYKQHDENQPTLYAVTTVTGVTTSLILSGKNEESKIKSISSPVTTVTPVTNSSALTLDDLKAVYWAEGQFGKKLCCVCGYERETSWTAETFKGEQKPLCEDCVQAYHKMRVEP